MCPTLAGPDLVKAPFIKGKPVCSYPFCQLEDTELEWSIPLGLFWLRWLALRIPTDVTLLLKIIRPIYHLPAIFNIIV